MKVKLQLVLFSFLVLSFGVKAQSYITLWIPDILSGTTFNTFLLNINLPLLIQIKL